MGCPPELFLSAGLGFEETGRPLPESEGLLKRYKTLKNVIGDARRHEGALVAYFIANTALTAVFSIAVL